MARQSGYENHESGWRELAWAGAAAALVTVVLVVVVALAWSVGGGSGSAPALTAPDPETPTPRAIAFQRATPAPTPPAAAQTSDTNDEKESDPEPRATADLLSMATDGDEPASDAAVFEASSAEQFGNLASGSWAVTKQRLTNDGTHAAAERWLKLSPAPGHSFAVEADIRVTNVLDSVCDQSFGVAGGSPSAGLVFGGGLIFPCGGNESEARLANIAGWQDGYNVAPMIANGAFSPGDDWHTYRFELRGDKLRLLIDGADVASGTADPGFNPDAKDVEAGLWSQGVGLEVRRVAVYPLPG